MMGIDKVYGDNRDSLTARCEGWNHIKIFSVMQMQHKQPAIIYEAQQRQTEPAEIILI